jgi:DNA-binding transcriptional LysR family regulator
MDREIELRHLRYFVAVAEELHFGRAALRLHLAQPPLSQQIRKLEAIVGHALFARTSRNVKLTSAGEILLERARHTLKRVEDDLAEARSVGRGETGFLKVGFIGPGMLTPLPALLGRYRRQYPNVRLQLHESFTAGVARGLAAGDLDAGFLRDGGPTPGLEVEALYSEPYVAVLPAGHPRARQKSVSPAELRHEPFVFFPPTAGRLAYDKTLSLFDEGEFSLQVVQEAPQWLTILRLVGAGLGVTIAPACVQQIASPAVVCRKLRGTRVMSDIELAYRKGEDRTLVKTFLSIARTRAADQSCQRSAFSGQLESSADRC